MDTCNLVKFIKQNGVAFIPHHECGLCEETVGYVVEDVYQGTASSPVYFESGCGCTKRSNLRPTKITEVVKFWNEHEKYIRKWIDDNRYRLEGWDYEND